MMDTVYQLLLSDSILLYPILDSDRDVFRDIDFPDNIDYHRHRHQYYCPLDIVTIRLTDTVVECDVLVETLLHRRRRHHIDHLVCIYHRHQSYYIDRLADNDHRVDSDRHMDIDLC